VEPRLKLIYVGETGISQTMLDERNRTLTRFKNTQYAIYNL